MQKALEKLAQQILTYDEASLTALWNTYSAVAAEFEPTRRWEEAVVILNIIQSVRWKNQLFNYYWKEGMRTNGSGVDFSAGDSRPLLSGENLPGDMSGTLSDASGNAEENNNTDMHSGKAGKAGETHIRAKVLRFRTRKDDETV